MKGEEGNMALTGGALSERRANKRHSFSAEAICFVDVPDGQVRPASLVDVSRSGLQLMMSRPLPDDLVTYVELPGKGQRRARLFQVRHIRRDIDGWCKLGGAFIPPLPEKDLKYLLRG